MGLAIILALASGATWAIGMTVAKPALRHIDAISYILVRWSLVAPVALLYAHLTGTLGFPGWHAVGYAALAGVLDSALGGLIYLMAMERALAYQTTTLASTAPLWGVASAMLVLGEPFRWAAVGAAVLVVVGAFFLIGRRLSIRGHVAGSLLGLLTGFLWGFSETIPAKLALQHGMSPATLLFVFSCAGLVPIAAALPLLRRRFSPRITRRGVTLTAASALGGAFLGWLLWLSSLERAPASVLSPIRGSTLLFSFLYAVVLLKECPPRRAVFGVLCVFGGVLLVSLR